MDVLIEAGEEAVEVRRLTSEPAPTDFPYADLHRGQPAFKRKLFGIDGCGREIDGEVDGRVGILTHEYALSSQGRCRH